MSHPHLSDRYELRDASCSTELRDQIEEFYRVHPEQTLKTLVCRAYAPGAKEYVALVTRGDRSVNFEQVAAVLGYTSIRLANPQEMNKLGLVVGFVSPIDCGAMKLFVDAAVGEYPSYYDGANAEKVYRWNVNFPRDFAATRVLESEGLFLPR